MFNKVEILPQIYMELLRVCADWF